MVYRRQECPGLPVLQPVASGRQQQEQQAVGQQAPLQVPGGHHHHQFLQQQLGERMPCQHTCLRPAARRAAAMAPCPLHCVTSAQPPSSCFHPLPWARRRPAAPPSMSAERNMLVIITMNVALKPLKHAPSHTTSCASPNSITILFAPA